MLPAGRECKHGQGIVALQPWLNIQRYESVHAFNLSKQHCLQTG